MARLLICVLVLACFLSAAVAFGPVASTVVRRLSKISMEYVCLP
jgi:hypothetical protein